MTPSQLKYEVEGAMNPLDIELAERAKRGFYPVTIKEMNDRLNAIGYELNRERDCYSNNRWMTGPRAGQSYPAINTGVREMDTKLEFCNVDARRDNNFKALQELRSDDALFAVVRGCILEI